MDVVDCPWSHIQLILQYCNIETFISFYKAIQQFRCIIQHDQYLMRYFMIEIFLTTKFDIFYNYKDIMLDQYYTDCYSEFIKFTFNNYYFDDLYNIWQHYDLAQILAFIRPYIIQRFIKPTANMVKLNNINTIYQQLNKYETQLFTKYHFCIQKPIVIRATCLIEQQWKSFYKMKSRQPVEQFFSNKILPNLVDNNSLKKFYLLNIEQFQQKFNEQFYTHKWIAAIDWTKFDICGGSVVTTLISNIRSNQFSDIGIFSNQYISTFQSFEIEIERVCYRLELQGTKYRKEFQFPPEICSIYILPQQTKLQFVFTRKTLNNVLTNFDINVVQIAYNPTTKTLIGTLSFKRFLETGYAVMISGLNDRLISWMRFYKYIKSNVSFWLISKRFCFWREYLTLILHKPTIQKKRIFFKVFGIRVNSDAFQSGRITSSKVALSFSKLIRDNLKSKNKYLCTLYSEADNYSDDQISTRSISLI